MLYLYKNWFYQARKKAYPDKSYINNENFPCPVLLLLQLLFHNDVCTHPSHTWEVGNNTIDFTTQGDLTHLYLYAEVVVWVIFHFRLQISRYLNFPFKKDTFNGGWAFHPSLAGAFFVYMY